MSQQLGFLAPVFIGDTITALVEVSEWRPENRILTLKTSVYSQDGKQVVTRKAVLALDEEVKK